MKWSVLVSASVLLASLIVLFSAPAWSAEYTCNSCSNCTGRISSASGGDTVRLTADVSASSASCITINRTGITLDCQSRTISCTGTCPFGIFINSSNNILRNCRVQGFNYGMFVMGSQNLIDNSVCSGNSWAGIDILGLKTGNTVRNSIFRSNTGQQGHGILLTGNVTGNRFINVTSTLNSRGLTIYSSSNSNTFVGLVISSNMVYGISMNESTSNRINNSRIENNPTGIWTGKNASYNLIYNNYFSNTVNARIDSGLNRWNTTRTAGLNIIGDGYVGGNFWSSYAGQDTDGDGIGNSPHSLGLNNYDYLPLIHPPFLINLAPPTPANASVVSRSWVFVNTSANRILNSCRLEWNGVNESMTVSGRYCWKNKTGISDGSYSFRVWANETLGNASKTTMRFITVSTAVQDTTPPTILRTVSPKLVVTGSNVSLMINASDQSGIDRTWVIVRMPNAVSQRINLVNGAARNYTASLAGRYNLTFFANDTAGNQANVSDYFNAQASVTSVNFTVRVVGSTGSGIGCNLTIYQAGTSTVVRGYQSTSGSIAGGISEGTYDLLFSSYYGNLQVLLRGVNISQNINRTIGLDRPSPPSGYVHTYAVNNTYAISSARARLAYTESFFTNESHIGVYVCRSWNFAGRSCSGSWNRTVGIQNRTGNYFDMEVTGFSAFSLKQEPYCGDGVCSSTETHANCPSDCECDAGETRACSVAHRGWCANGDEMCLSGAWTGCPSPLTEVCDREDNNCDGVIDNVLNGTSVSTTQCRCYGGASPGTEVCNGIDDDCDSNIDEDGDCCVNGQTRACGPGNETGICRKGTSTCASNVWGSCQDAVHPTSEICGNDEDDDCDGETDEDCWGWTGMVLILAGIIILIVIVILYLHFRKQGRELTWEELKRKWTPAYQ